MGKQLVIGSSAKAINWSGMSAAQAAAARAALLALPLWTEGPPATYSFTAVSGGGAGIASQPGSNDFRIYGGDGGTASHTIGMYSYIYYGAPGKSPLAGGKSAQRYGFTLDVPWVQSFHCDVATPTDFSVAGHKFGFGVGKLSSDTLHADPVRKYIGVEITASGMCLLGHNGTGVVRSGYVTPPTSAAGEDPLLSIVCATGGVFYLLVDGVAVAKLTDGPTGQSENLARVVAYVDASPAACAGKAANINGRWFEMHGIGYPVATLL